MKRGFGAPSGVGLAVMVIDATTRDPTYRSALRESRLFRERPAAADEVLARGQVEHLGRGAFLFFEGDRAADVHFLLAGHVKIVHETADGEEVVLRFLQSGDLFGGAGGWGEPAYPATAVALADSVVLRLPVPLFTGLIETSPELAMAVIRMLGARLRETEARIRELQTERAERRVARNLLRLAHQTGKRTAAGIELGIPLSRQHLAELAGTTLSTASRVLSEWDRAGLIHAGRERVTIVRTHDLVVIAEDLAGDGEP